uniref:uncharacterized protein LOC104266336 n=1 Tax=Ciona intestinalis TaxID=7719 RepID=UPI0005213A82|nr:uncharacterized protein LOC104266336 [Ciona intestinalis]|eukprot:XP_009860559.1 uncharacterized protein LOC104266336 [Ciona intestinalis]
MTSKGFRQNKDSFIFFTLSVNGPEQERVTEISLVSIFGYELTRAKSNSPDWFPRVLDKMTVCFDPKEKLDYDLCKSYSVKSQDFEIAKRQKFDLKVVNLLNLFLSRQSGELYLVGHGSYGFKVLQSELRRLGKSLDKVDERQVHFVDSEEIFKKIQPGKDSSLSRICDESFSQGMPQCATTEERNKFLIKVVLKNLDKFFDNFNPNFSTVPKQKSESAETTSELDQGISSGEFEPTQTHVYFDLETTRLRNSKITEICMVAVHIDSMKTPTPDSLPRIVDKMVLIVDPGEMIEQIASELTKLNNHIIRESYKPKFNAETTKIMAEFLRRQISPICLIAHNGMKFDFPLLKNHILASNSNERVFSGIRYADSVRGMRQLHSGPRQSFQLQKVYQRTFPQSIATNQHQAENDVIKLLKIVCSDSKLCAWLNSNYVELTDILV